MSGYKSVSTNTLKNSLKYGIINNKESALYPLYSSDNKEKYPYIKSDVIEKLKSPEEFRKHFEAYAGYEIFSPISETFSKINFELQKEYFEGIIMTIQ